MLLATVKKYTLHAVRLVDVPPECVTVSRHVTVSYTIKRLTIVGTELLTFLERRPNIQVSQL